VDDDVSWATKLITYATILSKAAVIYKVTVATIYSNNDLDKLQQCEERRHR
jgi:hypothetical protein